jgi:hypothetical protein
MLNPQPSGQNTKLVQDADEVTSAGQIWQFATPSYYIPKPIMPFRSTLVTSCYTCKMVLVLNPTVANSKLEHNQIFSS